MAEPIPVEVSETGNRVAECLGSPVVGLTSPEFKYFLWRSYRKAARALRRIHKKLRKKDHFGT